MLPYLVGPTALEKRQSWITKKKKLSPLMPQYIRQSKPSSTKAEAADSGLVSKKAKILPYTE